jgi:hypothetical protein
MGYEARACIRWQGPHHKAPIRAHDVPWPALPCARHPRRAAGAPERGPCGFGGPRAAAAVADGQLTGALAARRAASWGEAPLDTDSQPPRQMSSCPRKRSLTKSMAFLVVSKVASRLYLWGRARKPTAHASHGSSLPLRISTPEFPPSPALYQLQPAPSRTGLAAFQASVRCKADRARARPPLLAHPLRMLKSHL